MKRLLTSRPELERLREKQARLLMEPSLPTRQLRALDARAWRRFRQHLSCFEEFAEFKPGYACPILLRYFNGHTPAAPTLKDMGHAIGGGYAQEHVTLTVGRVVRQVTPDQIEVELEAPLCLSYGNGPRNTASRFLLCRDGTVRYQDASDWKEWSHHVPRWEPALLPQLEVVCSGFV
jgi:hypothetical protein